ncbi:Subunit of the glycosylphosphatidylinositol transamidase complex-like protein [Vermiconidia calcicola]|uniref:Subunit of the glycosylphosphatidylinositol transamidase complex-like protein n=1 Tax=Vermiconidia calcicola TaxID=1690605 RepID=A0ACC3N7M7_9PEZI|nr:Subunit of the glycosylphosphatidylinositol transamidase complex-like protein [Vermiconidia calcicola]
MRLSTLLTLPAALLPLIYAKEQHSYTEHLHLKPLPDNSLYAGFTFTSTTPYTAYASNHFRYFPRSLAQILQYTHTAELHLRFALGRWDEESWGSRPRRGSREGGNGVELWAWMDADAEEGWSDLVNSLSGLFCASLNFVDSGKTTRPVLSFEPEGTLEELQETRNGTGELRLLHGMLPHEVVCTENLTPFLKLLPCKGKAGISSLLDGHKLFDANWQTMAVDVRPICSTGGDCILEIQQTVDMVLDIERSMRPRESPIPRPLPIKDITCDETKGYNGHDTCYPEGPGGEMGWSLSSVFGRPIRGSCALGGGEEEEGFDITLKVPSERTVEVISETAIPQSTSSGSRAYRLPKDANFDLDLPHQALESSSSGAFALEQPPLYASRQLTGHGAERGGMHTLLRNPHPYAQRIVYLESLPWFLRPYMHTLELSGAGGKMEKMFYTPLLDRQRGTHLELLIEIQPRSTVEITYDFEKAILRYTEYPPDANRGFDIPAAVIRVLPNNATQDQGQGRDYYLRTTSLLLPLPTPDFSMPYNVIILTSTVIALGFGSIFNLLVRSFVLVEEVPVGALAGVVWRLKDGVARVRGMLKGGGVGKEDDGGGVVKKGEVVVGGEVRKVNGGGGGGGKKDT